MLVHKISVLNVFVKSLWKIISKGKHIGYLLLSGTNACVRWVSRAKQHACWWEHGLKWPVRRVPGMHKTGSAGLLAFCLASPLLAKESVGDSLLFSYPVFSPFCTVQSPEPFCSIHRTRMIVHPQTGKGLSELIPALKFTFLLYFCFLFKGQVPTLISLIILLIFFNISSLHLSLTLRTRKLICLETFSILATLCGLKYTSHIYKNEFGTWFNNFNLNILGLLFPASCQVSFFPPSLLNCKV